MDTIGVSQTDFLSGEISMTFDLEKARDAAKFDDHMAITMFPLAIAEIERLRGYEIAARDLSADLTKVAGDRDEQAAKIRELEDVHKRSGEKYAKIIDELRSSVYANIPGLKKQWDEILNAPANGKIGPDDSKKISHLRPYEVVAADLAGMLAKSWQITDERKAAIKELSELLTAIGCPSCHYYIQKNYGEDITVLKEMLKEATD
jgi:hypothetical protein